MIELEKFIKEQLGRLSNAHPDRKAIEGMAVIAKEWNLRRNGKSETITLSPEQLIASEKEAWGKFFGKEIDIPVPPRKLFDAQTHAQEAGITSFEAHYLPKVDLKQNAKHPGWKIKPEAWFWQKIKEGKVDKSATRLNGNWVLIDNTPKPNYDGGKQLYQSDPLAALIEVLRDQAKVKKYSSVSDNSRFGISADEIHNFVNPEIAKKLAVDPNQIRLPREIEFNVIGNIHHPEWGQTSTWEWFEDKLEGVGRLVGGGSGDAGLALVGYRWSDNRHDDLGFRPLVEFSSKP